MKESRILAGILTLSLLFTLIITLPARADLIPGHLDTGFDPGTGTNNSVYAVALQPDGKVLIGGNFTTVDGTARSRIARLNADGALDASFNPGLGADAQVNAVAVQPDGKILIGGEFTTVNGTSRNRIARLKGDGTLDTSFNPGTGVTGTSGTVSVEAVALQSDGKVLIGGAFSHVNGVSRKGIARLNADGSLDTAFDPGMGTIGVEAVVVQADGRVLIGGGFSQVNGVTRSHVARLNANGSVDTFFDPGTGPNSWVFCVAVQPDGRVVIGGTFDMVSYVSRKGIARLNADGSLDTAFDPGTGANSTVFDAAIQSDGKVIVGGSFTQVDGVIREYVARLNVDGSVDSDFDSSNGAGGGSILDVVFQPDGKFLIGGGFSVYQDIERNGIARLNVDGSLDIGLDSSVGASNAVEAVAHQSDGKVLIGGYFTTINGTERNCIARLNANGSVDSVFDPGTGANGGVLAVVSQSDGKVLMGGKFTSVNGTGRNYIARLNGDGSLDTDFNPGAGVNDYVHAVAVQPDGKVLIGGEFTSIYGTSRSYIARLNANGSLDTGFSPSAWTNENVYAVALQPDGKVLIAGNFTTVACTDRYRIARLNADGSLDASFDPGTGADYAVRSVALQPDGKVLIGGIFLTFDGISRRCIARLNANGSLDTSFNPGAGANGVVYAIALQPDGKVLIGGTFTMVNNTACNRIARLNADGSVDTVFDTSGGAGATVYDVAVQPDGKVLIGGSFTTVDGVIRKYIARLNGNRTFYVNKAWDYYGRFPAFGTIQSAVNAAGDGDLIEVGQGVYNEGPVKNTTGMVTISGGWNTTFTAQTGTTEMYAPGATGGGGIIVQPNVRIMAP